MDAHHLDPRIRTVWRVSGLLSASVVGAVLLVGTVVFVVTGVVPGAVLAAPVAVLVAALAFAWWWPGVRYRYWTYRMGEEAVELESGVVFRTRSVIPYFRVQHVDTSQGPIERRLDLANLKVHTASAATDAVLPGLAARDAEEIRRIVLERAGAGDAV